ncbi:nitroreductase family deazaflavin-dependent oxidoreductase [Nocardia sp. NBC_00403]|uniref:nitroreductase family deazaflavin-dependent oxidoreductase n=1 Tax=Nocardia sp. NBC_00403 TaxID=2975990 RepID=UPI002E23C6D5
MSNEQRQQLNREIIAEFRANGGVVGGQFANMSLLLLTTTGARTGEQRTWPLGYLRDGDRVVIFAANGGRPNKPGWYHNLVANPGATVEVGTESWPVVASIVEGAERKRLWDSELEVAPFLADFQNAVPWEIPVLALTPANGSAAG